MSVKSITTVNITEQQFSFCTKPGGFGTRPYESTSRILSIIH